MGPSWLVTPMHGHKAPEETERDAVLTVAERLKAVYAGRCAPEEIDAAVATAYAALRDRPVRAFIPVLVERRVRHMLKGPAN